MYKLDLEKSGEPEIKLPTSIGSYKKQRSSRKKKKTNKQTKKNIYLYFIDYTKLVHNKLGKFFKSWEYQTTLPGSWEICIQVKKQQLEQDMKQQIGSKLGKEFMKTV